MADSATVEQAVREQIARERDELERRLAEHKKLVKTLDKKYKAFDPQVDRILRGRDKKLSEDDQAVLIKWNQAGQSYRSTLAAVSKVEQEIEALNSEGEYERRLGQAQRVQARKDHAGNGDNKPTTPRRTRNMATVEKKKADSSKAVETATAYFKKYGSAEKAAEMLNKDKVPTQRGLVGKWRAVSQPLLALQTAKGGGAAARSNGSGRKTKTAGAGRKSKTATARKKNGAAPLTRAAQASGTSRGGTGKRTTAKTATARRGTKRSGSAKRKPATRRWGRK